MRACVKCHRSVCLPRQNGSMLQEVVVIWQSILGVTHTSVTQRAVCWLTLNRAVEISLMMAMLIHLPLCHSSLMIMVCGIHRAMFLSGAWTILTQHQYQPCGI